MGGGKGIVQEKSSDGPGPEKGRAGPDWTKSFRSAGLSGSPQRSFFLKKSGSGPAQTHHYNKKVWMKILKARAGGLRKLLNWFYVSKNTLWQGRESGQFFPINSVWGFVCF